MFKGLTRSNAIPVLQAVKQVLEKLLEQEDFDSDDKRQVQIALRNLKALPDQIPISSFKVSVLVSVEMGVIRYSLAINPTHLQLSSEQVVEIDGGQEIQGFYTLNATSTGEFAVHGNLEQWTNSMIDAIDDQTNEVRIDVGTKLELFEDEDEDNGWSEARKLLPAWFVDRMMSDNWIFGLLMTNGITIAIQQIDRVHQAADGTIWLDVELLDQYTTEAEKSTTFIAPTSRRTASINASHIMAAFELADT